LERKNRKRKNPNVHVLQHFGLYNKYHLLDYKMKTTLIFGSSGLMDNELLNIIVQNNNYNHIKLFVRSVPKNNF